MWVYTLAVGGSQWKNSFKFQERLPPHAVVVSWLQRGWSRGGCLCSLPLAPVKASDIECECPMGSLQGRRRGLVWRHWEGALADLLHGAGSSWHGPWSRLGLQPKAVFAFLKGATSATSETVYRVWSTVGMVGRALLGTECWRQGLCCSGVFPLALGPSGLGYPDCA